VKGTNCKSLFFVQVLVFEVAVDFLFESQKNTVMTHTLLDFQFSSVLFLFYVCYHPLNISLTVCVLYCWRFASVIFHSFDLFRVVAGKKNGEEEEKTGSATHNCGFFNYCSWKVLEFRRIFQFLILTVF
jgi:hypothetical protein